MRHVRRGLSGNPEGRSIIAGYPWFGDWGRDTMIALPGLALLPHAIEQDDGIVDHDPNEHDHADQRDDADVDACLQQVHGRRVSNRVR